MVTRQAPNGIMRTKEPLTSPGTAQGMSKHTTHQEESMNKPQTHDEYIAMVMSWGRKSMLSLIHSVGLKQGTGKLTDRDLAEVLYRHSQAN